jgi:hypothetical protein
MKTTDPKLHNVTSDGAPWLLKAGHQLSQLAASAPAGVAGVKVIAELAFLQLLNAHGREVAAEWQGEFFERLQAAGVLPPFQHVS